MSKPLNRYVALIAKIFAAHHRPGLHEFAFDREELAVTALALKIKLQKT